MATEPLEEGTVVITGHQTQGRGQRGNIWEAEKGKNITLSIYLEPKFLQASDQFLLNMAVSNGIFNALLNWAGADLKIKWPNDIYYENNKIGGVLIENSILNSYLSTAVIGIGININQENFNIQKATSLKNILKLGHDLEISQIIEKLLECIENEYFKLRNNQIDLLKTDYLDHLFRMGSWHNFKAGGAVFNGKIIDLDKFGRLILESETGLRLFSFKEVEFEI